MFAQLLPLIQKGDHKALARSISLVENDVKGYHNFLRSLPINRKTHLIGITGPPGAGKSTIVDALIGHLIQQGRRVGVLCVDPSSPFHLGALLGDRIRMSQWYNHPQVFIRSLATRGSLGGLHPRIIEITDILRSAPFDHIIVETVGVGQSEIEIAGLADTTVVVLVPEGGDEIQSMKAGVMEIADVFVVNKSDRPGADHFAAHLRLMLHTTNEENRPVIIKTIGSENTGISELVAAIEKHHHRDHTNEKKLLLLTEKAWHLLRNQRMQDISKSELKEKIEKAVHKENFNLYEFIEQF
jgi:LAO/AO transport system kinase